MAGICRAKPDFCDGAATTDTSNARLNVGLPFSERVDQLTLLLPVGGQGMVLDPFGGEGKGLSSGCNLIEDIGCEEGKIDDLLYAAGGRLFSPGKRGEGSAGLDLFIPPSCGQDVSGKDRIG